MEKPTKSLRYAWGSVSFLLMSSLLLSSADPTASQFLKRMMSNIQCIFDIFDSLISLLLFFFGYKFLVSIAKKCKSVCGSSFFNSPERRHPVIMKISQHQEADQKVNWPFFQTLCIYRKKFQQSVEYYPPRIIGQNSAFVSSNKINFHSVSLNLAWILFCFWPLLNIYLLRWQQAYWHLSLIISVLCVQNFLSSILRTNCYRFTMVTL